jgi:hypothetical protein
LLKIICFSSNLPHSAFFNAFGEGEGKGKWCPQGETKEKPMPKKGGKKWAGQIENVVLLEIRFREKGRPLKIQSCVFRADQVQTWKGYRVRIFLRKK